jgi:cytochrome c biogenesis protein CcdA
MLVAAAVLWRRRASLARRALPSPPSERRSALWLGATITGVELPTAFPYFAVIAAVVGSGLDPGRQVILLALYNLAFVLPLILMVLTLTSAPDRAAPVLRRARDLLQRYWPVLLAGLALLAGLFVTVLGVTGLAGQRPGTVGRLSRQLRRAISH